MCSMLTKPPFFPAARPINVAKRGYSTYSMTYGVQRGSHRWGGRECTDLFIQSCRPCADVTVRCMHQAQDSVRCSAPANVSSFRRRFNKLRVRPVPRIYAKRDDLVAFRGGKAREIASSKSARSQCCVGRAHSTVAQK